MIETTLSELFEWAKAERKRVNDAAMVRLYGLRRVAETSSDFNKIKSVLSIYNDLEEELHRFLLDYDSIEKTMSREIFEHSYSFSNFINHGNRVIELLHKEI